MENFRNFKALDLSFDQGFVVLHGPNGAGKTNFLEGLYFAASLQRFPDSEIRQLFHEESQFFRGQLKYQNREEGVLEVLYERGEEKVKSELRADGQAVSRQNFAGRLPVVSFLPQDMGLLTRSPGGRRRYLDETLSQSSAEYRLALSRYQKALRQRNELLGQHTQEGLEVWDEQLAQYGSELTASRAALLEYLNSNLKGVVAALDQSLLDIKFTYRNSGLPDQNQFLAALGALKKREAETGVTAMGPHRDDFAADIAGQRAAGYLSRGQLRAVTLALKILEKKYLQEKLGRSPVLLLDDIFSEFDSAHQKKLIEFLKTLEQVFLTTTHLEEVKTQLPASAQVLGVNSGKIIP